MQHILAKIAVCLFFAASLNAQAGHPDVLHWRVLDGPEREKGKPVQILKNSDGDLTLSVDGRRGTAIRHFQKQCLPAVVSFDFASTFDPTAREVPTELFGTGDFRVFIGSRGESSNVLGEYEGFQLRIFPHLGESPVRRVTDNESHTATSLWIRNIDPDRRTSSDGPHTGLLSDACQNRGRGKGRHNCGWSRVSLVKGGFGLRNGQAVKITVAVDTESVEITAGRWRHRYKLDAAQLRIDEFDTLAIGHTNISRGYETVTLSGISMKPLSP